ncbi:hypothetical protein BCR39DRAFT_262542 [Naematelia encephala]|uniref:RING-type domain-containing protein n=1 Tax=Naematelia encephala TaxID=71784 RepID=A0A1Y2AUN9_9TREE|nr:hypothetical protein BCR39DRAFT_262542 [Naematelia encephala]
MSGASSGNSRSRRDPLLNTDPNLNPQTSVASAFPSGVLGPARSPSATRRSLDGPPLSPSSAYHRGSTRVIKTFDEIEVPTIVTTEEWYEELECGICSHILAAPQALVPCGHTFCGPCAWQWIRIGKNYTCPHCRMEIPEATPLIPNIIVDQIIERKLRSLVDGPQKQEMIFEREEKSENWRVLQASLPVQKPPQRRQRSIDNIIPNLLEQTVAEVSGHRRRASRHLMELGAPVQHVPRRLSNNSNSPTLAEIVRQEIDEDALAATRAELRRLREALMREATGSLTPLSEEEPELPMRPRLTVNSSRPSAMPRHFSDPQAVPTQDVPRVEVPRPHPAMGRPTPHRSSILAARQARGRGSRAEPLVVHSDSE